MARRPGRKKGYTKAQKMAKARIAAKKTTTSTTGGSNNTTKLSGISKLQSLGRAPTKPGDTVAAKRFRERESQGLSGLTGGPKGETVTQYRARQRKQVTDAARKRNDAFRGTTAEVSRDNRMYGNTFPAGSFNISPAGEELAATNRAKFAEANPMLASNVYYGGKDAENRRRLIKDLKEFERRDPTTGGEGWKGFKFTDKVVNKFKDAGSLIAQIGGQGPHTNVKYDSVMGKFMPQVGAGYINNVRLKQPIPKADASETDMSGMTASMDLSGLGMTPKVSDYDPGSTAFAIATGNYDPAAYDSFKKSGLNLSDYTKKGSEKEKGRTGRVIENVAKVAARFNPLSAFDFATNDRTDLDRMGNLTIGGREIKPYNLVSDAAMLGNKLRKGDLTRADVTEGISDFTKTATADNKAKAFFKNYDADDFMKSLDVAKESKIVQNQLEKEGFPSDVKKQIANTFEGLKEETSKMEQGKVHNRMLMKTRVDEINNLLANVNQNPKLSTLSKIAGQFDPKTNPNADNMTAMDKIRAGFDPSSPNALALSATDRGIEGSAGNLLIGGKMSDIYKDAATNIPKGQIGLSSEDMFNIAKSAYENINTEGSLSAQRANEIANLIGPKGVTPGSLIRGVLPRRARSSGGNNNVGRLLNPTGTAPQQQILEELLINQTPTQTPTQTVGDVGNLQSLQQQAYLRALSSYGFNPNYFAEVRPTRFNTQPRTFSDYFRRPE